MSRVPRSQAAALRHRRDRHGRAQAGPLLHPRLPAWRSRRHRFDELVLASVARIAVGTPEVGLIEFAVEDVPPSDPAPWERRAIILGRSFPADWSSGLLQRIVIYRLPITQRCASEEELQHLVHAVVVENVASSLGRSPSEIDPRLGR